MPLVLLEAMAAQVPIVATRVGGVPEAIGNDEAWLVPPEDPVQLATAIAAALQDPEDARRRASSAADRLSTAFSFEGWLDSYEAVYRKVLQLPAEPAGQRSDGVLVTTTADRHSLRA
jgi:glycosyltransferase involved in cell wall biosynthesis